MRGSGGRSSSGLAFRGQMCALPLHLEIEDSESVVSDPHSSQELFCPWLKRILVPRLMSPEMDSTIPDEEPVEFLCTLEQNRRTPVPQLGEERAHRITNRGRLHATAEQAVSSSSPRHVPTNALRAHLVKSAKRPNTTRML